MTERVPRGRPMSTPERRWVCVRERNPCTGHPEPPLHAVTVLLGGQFWWVEFHEGDHVYLGGPFPEHIARRITDQTNRGAA